MRNAEEGLVERVKRERQAFSEVYQRYAPRIYSYIYQRTSSTVEAEELTAAVFLRALSHLDSYQPQGQSFGTWLFTIAHNLLVNWYRDRERRGPLALREVNGAEDMAAALATAEDVVTVQRAVASLPEERQQLIFLKYVEGLSNAEIGRVMGRSEGAVKSLLHRTLRALRKEIQRQHNGR
ncbi:MAG: RNA polymerase sigma factor [Dehalococcoidia bacterium]